MKTCRYLYNINGAELKDMLYIEAIEYKITKAKQLIEELQNVGIWNRDDVRIRDVVNAIKFNERLLNEVKE